MWSKAPAAKETRGGVEFFPSFQEKMKGYDGVFHAC